MNLSNAQAFAGLRATATPDAPNVRNDNEIGIGAFTQLLTGAQVAFSVRATMADGDVLTLDPLTNDASASVFSDTPTTITVTGITNPAGQDPIVLTKGDSTINGLPYWEKVVASPGLSWLLSYDLDNTRWTLQDSRVSSPYIATKTDADPTTPVGLTSWTVTNGAGSPVLTGSVSTGYIGGDGKDIYGATLPAIDTIQGIIVKCTSGAAYIEVSTDEKLTVSAGDTRLCFNADGMASFADDIEATASASNTVLDIIVIGKLSA
jgi:hypothetical protein